MSANNWKPGDVAILKYCGGHLVNMENVRKFDGTRCTILRIYESFLHGMVADCDVGIPGDPLRYVNLCCLKRGPDLSKYSFRELINELKDVKPIDTKSEETEELLRTIEENYGFRQPRRFKQ